MVVHPSSCGIPRAPQYSGYPLANFEFRLRACHPLWTAFPYRSAILVNHRVGPNPTEPEGPVVWPLPRSLATTSGISVDFFSSPYLDVSVQAVPRVLLFYS
jgi:hypothetical protein